jgi:hypothetical protein
MVGGSPMSDVEGSELEAADWFVLTGETPKRAMSWHGSGPYGS